jgi:hypothetical protein
MAKLTTVASGAAETAREAQDGSGVLARTRGALTDASIPAQGPAGSPFARERRARKAKSIKAEIRAQRKRPQAWAGPNTARTQHWSTATGVLLDPGTALR